MKPEQTHLESLLVIAAAGQLIVALLNLRLEKILQWSAPLASLPSLMREVFVVHKWFISIAVVIFALFTLRFADALGSGHDAMARWMSASIGAFWAIRTVLQWSYYGSEHWRGKGRETAVHWILTLVYGGWAALYGWCAFS